MCSGMGLRVRSPATSWACSSRGRSGSARSISQPRRRPPPRQSSGIPEARCRHVRRDQAGVRVERGKPPFRRTAAGQYTRTHADPLEVPAASPPPTRVGQTIVDRVQSTPEVSDGLHRLSPPVGDEPRQVTEVKCREYVGARDTAGARHPPRGPRRGGGGGPPRRDRRRRPWRGRSRTGPPGARRRKGGRPRTAVLRWRPRGPCGPAWRLPGPRGE